MGKPHKHYGKWRIRWVDERGTRRSAVYLDREHATLELNRRLVEVEERRRGLRPPEATPRTFADAATYWEQNRAPLKRSGHHDVSILRQLREHFSTIPLNDIGAWVEAVDRYNARKHHLCDKTRANHLTLLGAILRAARDLGWTTRVPPIKKPSVDVASEDYDFLQTQEEIRRFLEAARPEGEQVFVVNAVAIHTGLRAGELAGLRTDDVNFDTRIIMVQRSYTGPTKNKRSRPVPILDAVLPALRAWCVRQPGPLVFTNRDGNMFGPSARIFQEVLHRILDRAGFPRVMRHGKSRRYVTFHDLRHTFASHWMMNGGDLFKLQKILGHKTVQMTMRYAHLSPTAFKEDHGRFPDVEQKGEVIPFRRKTS